MCSGTRPAELAQVAKMAPAAAEAEGGSSHVFIKALAGAGLLLVGAAHPHCLCPVLADFADDILVGSVGQVPG